MKENNIAGLMMCIDFEKAFDTVKWEIFKTLEYFNCGEHTNKLVQDILQW